MTGLNAYHGMKVITSVHMTESQYYTVRRTWRERLFSLPWRPLVATKECSRLVPRTDVVVIDGHTWMMHPAMLEKLKGMIS